MPSLGADMESGTITEWRVSPGDHVARGQIVAVVETEKSDIEIEVFEEGVVESILVPVGCEVAVGTPLAIIAGAARRQFEPAPPRTPELAEPAAPRTLEPSSRVAPPLQPAPLQPAVTSPLVRRLADELHVDLQRVQPADGRQIHRRDVEAAALVRRARVAASPLARRLARERGIDLGQIATNGPRITARDLDAFGTAPVKAEGKATSGDRSARQQRAIGRLMERSKREIPHYYLSHDIDCTPMLQWMAGHNAQHTIEERLLPAALMLAAIARAASAHREFNGHYREGSYQEAEQVQLGVAISTRGGGLVAPVLRDAGALSLAALMTELRDLVTRTRQGALRSGDVEEATLTVTNLGDQGVGALLGVIIPPQVAIVGLGRVQERPSIFEGQVAVRSIVTVSLSADHRVSDGHRGARFLRSIEKLMTNPEELV